MKSFYFFFLFVNVYGVQRIVVAEEFTATWCPYCPGAAGALHRLMKESGDTLAVVAYHGNDAFSTSETESRFSYYNVTGLPTTWWDGVIKCVGGSTNPNNPNIYNWYRNTFNQRKVIPSPLVITLAVSYDSSNNQGTVNIHIQNTTDSTINGTLQCLLTETNIPYHWQTLDTLWDVVRDMIPNQNGEAITISANSSIDKTRNFTISSGWNELNCEIVVFVQGANKEIYQGAKIHIIEVGVEEKEVKHLYLHVEPNPFNKWTFIRYALNEYQKIKITVYDLSGAIVFSTEKEKVNKGYYVLNMEKLPSGVYFLSFVTEKEKITKKLILVK